jgi:ABC-type transporter Mla subunit MlaD
MLKKLSILALTIALLLTAFPVSTVAAADLTDETPPSQSEMTDEMLERAWTRALRIHEKLGRRSERVDTLTEKLQTMLDKATENGKDTVALQAALDTFNDSVEDVRPIYESASEIIDAHQGFDEDGNVTDHDLAFETIQTLREKLAEMHEAMDGSGRSLREAIKAFRQANPRPEKTEGTHLSPSFGG